MSEKIVRYEIDLHHPPPLTQAQKDELAALATRSESAIDYSDIPELDEHAFVDGVQNLYLLSPAGRHTALERARTAVPVSIDGDIVEWLAAQPGLTRERVNDILRREMMTSQTKAESERVVIANGQKIHSAA